MWTYFPELACLFLQKSGKNVASNSKMRTELRQAGSESNELKKTIYIKDYKILGYEETTYQESVWE